jgi:hypothetical protein
MTQASLQRLVLRFSPGEAGVEIRALYRTKDGPGPSTKARRWAVEDLAREGLHQALASLEGSEATELVGCSGFSQREDVICEANRGVREGGPHPG